MIFKGEFFFNLSVYFCLIFHLYICCVFIFVGVFISVCIFNSITMLEFFIFVKYLSNIEDNV